MSSVNDSKILTKIKSLEVLLEEATIMKTEVGNTWKTSKVFDVSGTRFNIKKLSKEELFELATIIHSINKNIEPSIELFDMSTEEKDEFSKIQGFLLEDWNHDLKQRWRFINLHEHVKNYTSKIEKLKELLSEDQIRAIELDKLLND